MRRAHVPYIEAKNSSALFEHEATTSKISETCCSTACSVASPRKRPSASWSTVLSKTCCKQLPMEFAVEAQKLISISLKGPSDKTSS